MTLFAQSCLSTTADSTRAGRELGEKLRSTGERIDLVLTYLTVSHDQALYLRGLREAIGQEVPIVGCSAQGVVGRSVVREEGYVAGVLGLGGASQEFAVAALEDIQADSYGKGEELGRMLRAQADAAPAAVVLHYDALSRVDPESFVQGLYRSVQCPIVGGASAHSFNYRNLQETYQYFGDRVLTRAAVAFALPGELSVEIASCHGCSPVGVELTVTRAEGNVLYELDGRPASDVWEEICGKISDKHNQSSALAIGVPVASGGPADYLVRAGYVIDPATGSVALGPAIKTGTRIMLHHRTMEDVLGGAREMGGELARRIGDRKVKAVLGFECGARTKPFLGTEATIQENVELQQAVGDDETAWIGMFPWGEVYPIGGSPTFHNYSYPVIAILE